MLSLLLLLGLAAGATLVDILLPLLIALGVVKDCPYRLSPEAKLVAMSRSSLVVHGPLCPNSWMSSLQVVPTRNALTTSVSVTLGSSVH
jgi:hypothetical protein